MDRFAAMSGFVRVVETGSFSEAARQLRVGQPAVSKSVAQLEQHLGVRLLLRSTRGLTPTESGHSFYEHAKRALEEADEAELAARGAGATLTGRLRVGAAVTFARINIVPHLGAFLQQHPELEIELLLDDRTVDLLEEGVDVMLRMGTPAADAMSTARKIAAGRRLLVGSPGYLAAVGIPASPSDLGAHQVVIYGHSGGDTWTFTKESLELPVTVNGRIRTTAAEAARAAVLAGLGLAVVSEWMMAAEIASGEVIPVLADWQLPSIDLWAVFPSGRRASAKARAFVTFVEAQLRARSTAAER
jgi:DNA-binding transcriptional LysR family regulator